MKQNEAKPLFRGHCPLCTSSGVGAVHLRTVCPGQSKPTVFLGLCSPDHGINQ